MSPTPLRLDSDFSTTWVCGPFADGLNAKRRHRAGGTSVVAGELPPVVRRAAVRDDVLRDVLHDQIIAADAERGFLVEIQRARIPPHDRVPAGARERVLARTDRGRPGRP